MRNLGAPPLLDDELRRFVWPLITGGADIAALAPYADIAAEGIHPEELLAPAWAFYMEEYLRQRAAGVPFLAIRYDELDANREAVAARLLRHCGLPAGALTQRFRALSATPRRARPSPVTVAGRCSRRIWRPGSWRRLPGIRRSSRPTFGYPTSTPPRTCAKRALSTTLSSIGWKPVAHASRHRPIEHYQEAAGTARGRAAGPGGRGSGRAGGRRGSRARR